MKKALISPNELVTAPDGTVGARVAQVVPDGQDFPIAQPLFWDYCPDNCVADECTTLMLIARLYLQHLCQYRQQKKMLRLRKLNSTLQTGQ
jgi:hypothetical protein